MSTPIYTATAGPADPNGGLRAKFYAGLAVVVPLLSFLATLGVLTSDQASAITAALTSVTGLLGTFGFGLAAVKTNKQSKNGTFDPAPPPAPVISTAEQIANAIPAVVQGLADKQAEVDLIKNVAAGALGNLPGIGGAAADLIRQIPTDLHLP